MPLRAGLVGLGTMGRHHERVMSEFEGVSLVGVYDPVATSVRAPTFRSLSELVGLGLDYCVVAAPTHDHYSLGLQLAESQVPTLFEKPLCQDASRARELVLAFEACGAPSGVGHIERYNAALASAKSRIAEGDLGRVIQLTSRRQGPYPARISDVGVILDLATHDIDSAMWVLQSQFASVAALTAQKSGDGKEDLVSWIGRMEDGVPTSHIVDWLSPYKERTTVVTGELGTFVIDTLKSDLTFYANGIIPTVWDGVAMFHGVSEGDVVRYAIPKPEPLRTEHENFLRHLAGEPADVVTLREGWRVIQVAEALLESSISERFEHPSYEFG